VTRSKRKPDGTVEVIFDCLLCGSRKNLGINHQKGVWHCWACGQGGALANSPVAHLLADLPPPGPEYTYPIPKPQSPPGMNVFPESVWREVDRRKVSRSKFLLYEPVWDGNRICWPMGSGWARRSIWPGAARKVITDSVKDGLIGGCRLKAGSRVVLTEGDWKALSIPDPWIGVAASGTACTALQRVFLRGTRPDQVWVLYDGGKASEALRTETSLRELGVPAKAVPDVLPHGRGPDDVPPHERIRILLGAEDGLRRKCS
jgi:hypothetical protein